MKRIGARAHDYGTLSADGLAKRLADYGFCCAQVALNKAIAGLSLQAGQLNPGFAWEIGRGFQAHGIQIAVLGCYINPVNPDDRQRAELLRFFKDHLRFVGDMGGNLVGLETGTPNVEYAPDPNTQNEETFQALVRSIAELVECAEACGSKVAVEAVAHHTISTPERMRRLIDEIRSPAMVVIHDPVNFINGDNYQEEARFIEEPFQLYGDRIAIIHAKDYSLESGKYEQVATGLGCLDYGRLCSLIAKAKPGISILLEDSGPEVVDICHSHIEKHWQV